MRWTVLVATVLCSMAIAQPLKRPQGVAFSPDGTKLAISDTGNGRVLVLGSKEAGVKNDHAGEKGSKETWVKNRIAEWRLQAVIADVHEPHGLAWLDEQRLAVCETGKEAVTIFHLRGRRGFSPKQTLTGFKRPIGVMTWRDWLFVADAEKHRIVVFSSLATRHSSPMLTEFGKEGNGKGELRHPTNVSVANDGTVFVADEGNGRVAVWKKRGTGQGIQDKGQGTRDTEFEPNEPYALTGFWTCRSVEVVGDELWALSSFSGELKRVKLNELAKPQWRIFTGFLDGTQREVTAVHTGHRTPDGQPSRHSIFASEKIPSVLALGRIGTPISPAADFDVACVGDGDLTLLAIATGDRVLILPFHATPSTSHPAPILPTRPQIFATQTDAVVTWETPAPTETVVEFRSVRSEPRSESGVAPSVHGTKLRSVPDYEHWQRVSLPGKRTRHRVLLRNLQPATAYRLRLPLFGCYEITTAYYPLSTAYSHEFTFTTQPLKGTTAFLRIPIAVLVYADVVNVDTLTKDAPPAPPIDRSYLDYLRREVEVAQLFYWCNSHMNLWLDCDWFIVTKRITVGKDQPPQMDWRRDLEALLKLRGKSLSDYPAAVEIVCERRWNEQRKRYEFAPSGGGTYGADMRPGSSHFLGGSDIAWLFVHEFHHQLDSQFAESGYPEHPFNHFSITPEGFADNFGEHYDGNAWLMRYWHGGDFGLWFVNKFGEVVTATDADGDGIPDDCPAVPLDEKRFGSDPTKADTDSDGLSDMNEVLASSWVFEMLPAVTNARAKYVLANPRNPDADGDGILDSQDPLPLYACEPTIRRDKGQRTSGTGERRWFCVDEDLTSVPSPCEVVRPIRPLHGDIFVSHDGEWLKFTFAFSEPVPFVHVQLDCDADGYWVGADNLDVLVRINWEKQEATPEVTVNNGASRERWPFPDKTLMPAENVRVTAWRNDLYKLVVAIKRTDEIGLTLQSGERVSLAIYLLAAPDSDRWLSVFEPYRLVTLTAE